MVCTKCSKMSGVLILLVGVGFLLVDLKVWNFWNLSGWTVLFLLVGLLSLGCACCPMCKSEGCCGSECKPEPVKAKKK